MLGDIKSGKIVDMSRLKVRKGKNLVKVSEGGVVDKSDG